MKRAFRILRWVAIAGICCLVVSQLFGPGKTNPALDPAQSIEYRMQVTPQVAGILERSCNDCHSNKTRWPWYSNVAPVSWFVIGHVDEGRQNLNFSEWGRYTQRDVDGLLKQICREVKAGAMPLSSYTPLHPGSKLSAEDRKILCDWTDAERAHPRSSAANKV
ncbi:MAG TPA: heme-binding domain-containing protein [Pyrinomonadaceae bacterium]